MAQGRIKRLQAAALVVCYTFDRMMARSQSLPAWLRPLRAALTAIGATSLLCESMV